MTAAADDPMALTTLALAALDALAADGDGVARHCAELLRGRRRRPGGRPAIDDTAALARIAELRRAGKGRQAVAIVAAQMSSDPRERAAIARRLRLKLNGNNQVFSAT